MFDTQIAHTKVSHVTTMNTLHSSKMTLAKVNHDSSLCVVDPSKVKSIYSSIDHKPIDITHGCPFGPVVYHKHPVTIHGHPDGKFKIPIDMRPTIPFGHTTVTHCDEYNPLIYSL